jgi:hypothetical protein
MPVLRFQPRNEDVLPSLAFLVTVESSNVIVSFQLAEGVSPRLVKNARIVRPLLRRTLTSATDGCKDPVLQC